MALRPDLKVIGSEIGSSYLEVRRPDPAQNHAAPQEGRRWFSCRHCHTIHLGGAIETEAAGTEAAECFAHEALCAKRPTEVPLSGHERAALEAVYGTRLRGYIAALNQSIKSGAPPAERARAAERRGVLAGELIRIGLPVHTRRLPAGFRTARLALVVLLGLATAGVAGCKNSDDAFCSPSEAKNFSSDEGCDFKRIGAECSMEHRRDLAVNTGEPVVCSYKNGKGRWTVDTRSIRNDDWKKAKVAKPASSGR